MFQCNFSAKRVRREATEWSDKGSWSLVWVWAGCVCDGVCVCGGVCGPLKDRCEIYHLYLDKKAKKHVPKNVKLFLLCIPCICNQWFTYELSMFRLNVFNIVSHSVMLYNMTSSYYTLCNHLCLLSFTGSGRKYQLYAIHTSKACNILSKYTAFIPIDLDTNEYLQTCIEYINPSKSSRI